MVLHRREFDLFQMLLEVAGRVLRRGSTSSLRPGEAVGSNALAVHIHHLVQKPGADPIRNCAGGLHGGMRRRGEQPRAVWPAPAPGGAADRRAGAVLGLTAMLACTAHAEADSLFDAQMVQVAETPARHRRHRQTRLVAGEMAEHPARLPAAGGFPGLEAGRGGRPRRWCAVGDAVRAGWPRAGFRRARSEGELWRFFTIDHDHSGYRVIVGCGTTAPVTGWRAPSRCICCCRSVSACRRWRWGWGGGRAALRLVSATAEAVAGWNSAAAGAGVGAGAAAGRDRATGHVHRRPGWRVSGGARTNERRFTADARSTSQRTPLVALKIQAQVAARAGDEATRKRAGTGGHGGPDEPSGRAAVHAGPARSDRGRGRWIASIH